jgi:hypothetical protein
MILVFLKKKINSETRAINQLDPLISKRSISYYHIN